MSYAYARDTTVPIDRSRCEIERMLTDSGATKFMYGNDGARSILAFHLKDRTVKITICMPNPNDRSITHTDGRGMRRSVSGAREAYEQECKRRWREMCLVIKAKLIAIRSGITTVEREFFADIVLPNGRTMFEFFEPKLGQLQPGDDPTFQLMMPASDH